MDFATQRLSVINLGDHFLLSQLYEGFLDKHRAVRYRDAWLVEGKSGQTWLFNYGIVVFWGVAEEDRQTLLAQLQPYLESKAGQYEHEDYTFELGTTQLTIRHDTIFLPNSEPLQLLAISHALAQSLQLNLFETQAQQTIQETKHYPLALAQTGKIPLGRKQIAMIRGQLLYTKSNILLHYELLDTPEFFWEYPELEPTYSLTARYLDIRSRVELLSQKLSTIHELFEMLADEQKHQHSAILEWIIIILIAVEIVLFGIKEITG